jgi:hypothetical protein
MPKWQMSTMINSWDVIRRPNFYLKRLGDGTVSPSTYKTLVWLAQSIELAPNYQLGPTEHIFKLKMEIEYIL